jgi:hypothetical protein
VIGEEFDARPKNLIIPAQPMHFGAHQRGLALCLLHRPRVHFGFRGLGPILHRRQRPDAVGIGLQERRQRGDLRGKRVVFGAKESGTASATAPSSHARQMEPSRLPLRDCL